MITPTRMRPAATAHITTATASCGGAGCSRPAMPTRSADSVVVATSDSASATLVAAADTEPVVVAEADVAEDAGAEPVVVAGAGPVVDVVVCDDVVVYDDAVLVAKAHVERALGYPPRQEWNSEERPVGFAMSSHDIPGLVTSSCWRCQNVHPAISSHFWRHWASSAAWVEPETDTMDTGDGSVNLFRVAPPLCASCQMSSTSMPARNP